MVPITRNLIKKTSFLIKHKNPIKKPGQKFHQNSKKKIPNQQLRFNQRNKHNNSKISQKYASFNIHVSIFNMQKATTFNPFFTLSYRLKIFCFKKFMAKFKFQMISQKISFLSFSKSNQT
jgi:hypothetical protein